MTQEEELLAAQQAPPPMTVGAVEPPPAPPIAAPQTSPEDALALADPAAAPPAPGTPVSPRDALIMGDEGPAFGPPAPAPGVEMPAPIGQPTPADAPKSADGIQEGMDTVKADREKTNEALISQHEGEAEKTHAEAEAATQRRVAAEETARKEAEAAAHYDAAEKQAQADTAQTKAALAKFKFRDLWASKTTVQKVGTALSSALLAIGAGMMKTPKYAIEILDKEKDDDYKQQVDHLNQLKDADVMARTGLNDVRAARGRAMADITMAAAQKDRVIAAQFEETALRAKDQNSAQEGMAYAARLKQDADEKDLQAHIQIRNLRLQDAATLLKQQETEARTRELDALTKANLARAAGTGGYAKHGKGHGGGAAAAGGNAAVLEALQKSGGELTPEVADIAAAHGVKDKQLNALATQAKALESRTLHDPDTGEALGRAPTGRGVTALADQLTQTDAYVDAVNALADHIKQHGHLMNPMSDDYKERESLAANVQAMGRKVKGIQASDAGQKLEHMVIGGKGTGFERSADPEVLRRLADEARTMTRHKLTASLTPIAGQGAVKIPEGGARATPVPAKAAPSPKDRAALEWANSHPDDPRAAKIKEAAGVIVL